MAEAYSSSFFILALQENTRHQQEGDSVKWSRIIPWKWLKTIFLPLSILVIQEITRHE